MVKIRLSRGGKKNDPFYRIVVIDERKRREGGAIEILGQWHPREKTKTVDMKSLNKWIEKGAVVSPGVAKLL